MRLSELKTWVEQFEEWPPQAFTWTRQRLRLPDWWIDLLGLEKSGSGVYRDYSEGDGRLIVSWLRVTALLGYEGDKTLRRQAAYELADHDYGWVVITEQTVNWTRHPTARVFDRGAVCIPVPEWKEAA